MVGKVSDQNVKIFMLFSYFNIENLNANSENLIFSRRNRNLVDGFRKVTYFGVGDVVEVIFFRGALPFIFEGVCIALRKKKLKSSDTSFILRNVIFGIGIEMVFSY